MAAKDDVGIDLGPLKISERYVFDFTTPSHLPKWPTAKACNVKLQDASLWIPRAEVTDQQKRVPRIVTKRNGPHPSRSKLRRSVDSIDVALALDVELSLEPSNTTRPQSPSRSEGTLTLKTLPPELRNIIDDLVIEREDTFLKAKLRTVFRPKGQRKGAKKVTRRYPLEPQLATVSRQFRYEVLSRLYGTSGLIVEKGVLDTIKAFEPLVFTLTMFPIPNPVPSAHTYIKHLKMLIEGHPIPVEFEIELLSNGMVRLRIGARGLCTCFDQLALDLICEGDRCTTDENVLCLQFPQLEVPRASDLISLASWILMERRSILRNSAKGLWTTIRNKRAQWRAGECDGCHRPRMRWVEL